MYGQLGNCLKKACDRIKISKGGQTLSIETIYASIKYNGIAVACIGKAFEEI